jgi:hypothetical protein
MTAWCRKQNVLQTAKIERDDVCLGGVRAAHLVNDDVDMVHPRFVCFARQIWFMDALKHSQLVFSDALDCDVSSSDTTAQTCKYRLIQLTEELTEALKVGDT